MLPLNLTGRNDHRESTAKLHRRYNAEVVADDYATLAAAVAASAGKILRLLPNTVYETAVKLDLSDRCLLIAGPNSTIKATAEMDYVCRVYGANLEPTQHFGLETLKVDGNNLATNGVIIERVSRCNAAIVGLEVTGAIAAGVIFRVCQGGVFIGIQSDSNGGDGILLEACNASTFIKPKARRNGGNGIAIARTVAGSGGCTLIGAQCEENDGHGIAATGTTSQAEICGGWLEANDGDGVNLADCLGIQVHGLQISGVGDGSNRGVRLTGTTKFAHVHDNLIARHTDSDSSYAAVTDETGTPANNVIEHNHNFSAWL